MVRGREADLPGLNALGVRFVIASFALTDGARPSRDVKTIIARSVDGRIQTTQAEDTMTQTSATKRGSEQADAIRPFNVNFPEDANEGMKDEWLALCGSA
jgi:hypothetical protein